MPLYTTRQRQINLLMMRLLEFAAFELEASRKQFKGRINSYKFSETVWDELHMIHLNDQLRRAEADCEEAGNEEYDADNN